MIHTTGNPSLTVSALVAVGADTPRVRLVWTHVQLSKILWNACPQSGFSKQGVRGNWLRFEKLSGGGGARERFRRTYGRGCFPQRLATVDGHGRRGRRIGFLFANGANVLQDLNEAARFGDGFGLRKFRLSGNGLFAELAFRLQLAEFADVFIKRIFGIARVLIEGGVAVLVEGIEHGLLATSGDVDGVEFFAPTATFELPGGFDDAAEDHVLQSAVRLERGTEVCVEQMEVLVHTRGDELASTGERVSSGVLGGELDFPVPVRGPLDLSALARLAAVCAAVAMVFRASFSGNEVEGQTPSQRY